MVNNIEWSLQPNKKGGWSYTIKTPAGLVVGSLRPMTKEAAKRYVEKLVRRYEERWLTIR